jgi:predicted Zn-dependent peptidase
MRFIYRWFITICFVSMLFIQPSVSFAADPAPDINIDVEAFRLDNGMLFLVVERPTTPQVAVRLAIRAGSALEDAGKTGIAHLLEHMMFKGTKNFGTLDFENDERLQQQIEAAYQTVLAENRKRDPDPDLIRQKLEEMARLRREVQQIYVPQAFSSQLSKNGAVGINAFTSKDQTQYVASVPSDMLEQWFSIISEQIFEPSWREFYVEKEVVQREWAFRYVNNPAGAAWLDLAATAYTAHPYRNPTIGWRSDMDRYNTTDAMAFHRKYYHPTNAVCVLVGDVKVEDVKNLAGIYFQRYPSGPRSPETVTAEPTQKGTRSSIRYLEGARTPLVRIGFHGAHMGTRDFYALDALTMILSQGRSARMTRNLTQKGLAVNAWAYNPDNRYGGMVVLGGSPNEPDVLKNADIPDEERRQAYVDACRQLESLLLKEVERLKSVPVSESELRRIKKLNEREFLDRMRSNESLAGTLATLEVQIGWQYLNEYLSNMATVSPEDIRAAARRYLRTENMTRVYVIPGGEPDQPAPAYSENRTLSVSAAGRVAAPGDLENHSIYATPEGWKHPLSFQRKPQKIRYPEAQTAQIDSTPIFFLPHRELPLIDMTILVKAGEVDIDPDHTGLATLLDESLIEGGTRTHAPADLARILDDNAIRLSFDIAEEEATIRLSVLKEDWETAVSLLEEIITAPAFAPEIIEVVKEQTLTGLRRQGDDASAVAMREAMVWHFQDHPYGRDPILGLKTIPSIRAADLKEFLRAYFVPANMVVALSGDIDRERALKGIGNLLEALPQTTPPNRRLEDPQRTESVLALIHKPGQVQSQVIMVLPGIERSHPDYWKLRLLTDIFGGNDSLLYTRLRDDLGLVYSAGFFQTYKWQAGLLLGYIGCKGDKTATAISETVQIMNALRRDIPQQELALKRAEVLNSFVFNVDTPAELVEVYGRYQLRGEPLDTLERIQDAYMETTDRKLLELARTYLDPQALQIFVVGDRAIPVSHNGNRTRLAADLKRVAGELGIPYREIELR